jgi:hypothetical protein
MVWAGKNLPLLVGRICNRERQNIKFSSKEITNKGAWFLHFNVPERNEGDKLKASTHNAKKKAQVTTTVVRMTQTVTNR